MSLYEYFDTVFFPIRICLRFRMMAAFRQVASLRAKHSNDLLRTAGTLLASRDRSPTTLRGNFSFKFVLVVQNKFATVIDGVEVGPIFVQPEGAKYLVDYSSHICFDATRLYTSLQQQ